MPLRLAVKKILLSALLLLCSSCLAICQRGSVPGYFVVNGDTTQATLVIGNYDELTRRVVAIVGEKQILLKPDSVAGFGFEKNVFEALHNEIGLPAGDFAFFHVVVRGHVGLLLFPAADHIKKIIRTPTGDLIEMKETFRTEDGRKISGKEFVIALKTLMKDAPPLYGSIDKSQLKTKDLSEIVTKYNLLKDATSEVFGDRLKLRATVIAYGGITSGLKERTVFRAGLGTELRRAGLSKGSYFAGGIFFQKDPLSQPQSNDFEIAASLALGMRLGRNPLNPNAYFGLMPTLLFATDNYGDKFRSFYFPFLLGINKRFELADKLSLHADVGVSRWMAIVSLGVGI